MSAAAVIGAGGLAFLAFEYGKFGNNYPLMYFVCNDDFINGF